MMSIPVLRRNLAVLAICGLSACAALPKSERLPALIDPAALGSERSFATGTRAWPADDWWVGYGDAQLDRLMTEALAGSPDLATARARLDKAKAVLSGVSAALAPSISANGSAAETKQSYNNGFPAQFVPKGYRDGGRITLDFSYEIDFWGKNRAAIAAATSDARAAQAEEAQARLILTTNVAAAYADLARSYAERDVAKRAAQSREETLALVGRRVANGLDTRGELSAAAAGPAAARADLGAIDEEIALTRLQLAAFVGAGPDRGAVIARPVEAKLAPQGLPSRLAAELIGRRPDLIAARQRAKAAAKRIHQSAAAFYPNLNLTAFIGYQSLGLANLLASGSGIGQAGPAISLPIFEGGRLRANLRGAQADYAVAVAAYNATLIEALRSVAAATTQQRALASRLKDSREALTADEDAYRIARLRYEGGLSNYQGVLLVEEHVLQSRRLVVDLKARAFALDIQLIRALGGGFSAPFS